LPRRRAVSKKLRRRSDLDETTPNDPTTITRPNGKMTLLSCPSEMILEIGGYLSPKDLNSLVLTNRLFYGILNERLYKLPPSDDALLHTIKNHRISTMKRFIDGGLDVNMSVPHEIYLPMLGSVTLLCHTIEWGSPYIARMLLEAGASADMCYISSNTATLGLGKLLCRFGAHCRRPPPEIALRMVKSNHWNLGFNNEKLLIMAYPDVIVWFVLV
jgi:hypothetical protein